MHHHAWLPNLLVWSISGFKHACSKLLHQSIRDHTKRTHLYPYPLGPLNSNVVEIPGSGDWRGAAAAAAAAARRVQMRRRCQGSRGVVRWAGDPAAACRAGEEGRGSVRRWRAVARRRAALGKGTMIAGPGRRDFFEPIGMGERCSDVQSEQQTTKKESLVFFYGHYWSFFR